MAINLNRFLFFFCTKKKCILKFIVYEISTIITCKDQNGFGFMNEMNKNIKFWVIKCRRNHKRVTKRFIINSAGFLNWKQIKTYV